VFEKFKSECDPSKPNVLYVSKVIEESKQPEGRLS